jgi:hypothetical protein
MPFIRSIRFVKLHVPKAIHLLRFRAIDCPWSICKIKWKMVSLENLSSKCHGESVPELAGFWQASGTSGYVGLCMHSQDAATTFLVAHDTDIIT